MGKCEIIELTTKLFFRIAIKERRFYHEARIKTTRRQAKEHLEQFMLACELAKLIRHFFPDLVPLLKKQDEITDTYEKLYPAYGEETPEYDLLSTIAGIGLDEEKNVVTIGIDELSEQKINTFISLFGGYDCVEFEECAPAQFAETYYPGRGIYYYKMVDGERKRGRVSIGFRCKRTTSDGKTQYGYVTCGHGCKDSVDKRIYASNKTGA